MLLQKVRDAFSRKHAPLDEPPAEQECYAICYKSISSHPLSNAAMQTLVLSARMRNVAANISGALIHDRSRFWQVLEGPQSEVERVFNSIANDYRHSEIVILDRGVKPERQFPSFEMGEVDLTTEETKESCRANFETILNASNAAERDAALAQLTPHLK